MKSNKFAAVAVISAGILWGIISIFVKKLSAAGLTSPQIAFVRIFISAISIVLFLLITDRNKLKIRLRDCWIFVGTGLISVTLTNICYAYAVINGNASVAVVLLYSSPIFIMLLSALIFHEKITSIKLIALILTLSGCVFISGMLGGNFRITWLVFLVGIASGLSYGLYTIFGKFGLAKYDPLTVTAYTFIFGVAGISLTGDPIGVFRTVTASPGILLPCLGIGIFSTFLPYILYTWGLQRMDSGKAAILVAVEPLIGCLIGMVLFQEDHSFIKIAGILCILAAIVLLNLPQKNEK